MQCSVAGFFGFFSSSFLSLLLLLFYFPKDFLTIHRLNVEWKGFGTK